MVSLQSGTVVQLLTCLCRYNDCRRFGHGQSTCFPTQFAFELLGCANFSTEIG